jgi:hypothetical protein
MRNKMHEINCVHVQLVAGFGAVFVGRRRLT